MDRLAALEAFAAVAERGGFAAAARALRVSPSTVTRLVAGLEERVGIRLLTRTTRSVRLTDGGARFLEYTRRILADVTEAEESARRERARPTGRLVVTAPVLFGRMHVGGVLCAYLTRYPEVTGELRLTDRIVNLVDEGVDVAVRIGELAASGLIARRVGASRRVLVGAPRYLDGAAPLRAPRDLQRHTLIALLAGPTANANSRFGSHATTVQVVQYVGPLPLRFTCPRNRAPTAGPVAPSSHSASKVSGL